jgi:hypothetical protein
MATKKVKGVESQQEVSSTALRPDTRPFWVRSREYFLTTDGVVFMAFAFPVVAALLAFVPFSGEILVAALLLFYQLYVNPGHTDPKRKSGMYRKYDFPFRVPFFANVFDGSVKGKKLGEGISYLGKEISTDLEIWSSNTDLRTHMLILGTTGSGKTEFLLGLVYNALVQNSGFLYTDGKGDVSLFSNVFRLARYLGREDDLLTLNFLTSGRDFLDKQADRTTNTMNPFALGSSGMLIELIISLMDDSGGGGDMWKGRAIAFVAGLTRALCFLRDKGYLLLDANKFIQYFELPVVEKMVWDLTITEGDKEVKVEDPLFTKVLEPLKAFILTLPGYKRESKGAQEQKTLEQHGFITMQLTRLFGDMSFTYGHLFQTTMGEVDMYDVVINRRILVCLLPALERAPDSLKMLGKLIVGAVKQMMAGCLGNRLEGAVREIVKSRPTNAKVPFYVVLDEYGYYAVLGFAVAPAQARSLGFPQPDSASVRMADGKIKRMGDMAVGDVVALPDGRAAEVSQVLDQGVLPVSKIYLQNGMAVEAANVHHWPARLHGVGGVTKLMTTVEIIEKMNAKVSVELSYVENGQLRWARVEHVKWMGIMQTKCLVIDDDLHCYLTDHDIVTHNCIIFAAQDFSSLQKASKEEADATWENTNVRALGKTTAGKNSETWRRFADVAGDAKVHESTRKEHDAGVVSDSYITDRDTQIATASRLEYDDVAAQQDGEFTVVVGKKTHKGQDGVRVIRARGFYTALPDERSPSHNRLNHFIKIEPPLMGSDNDDLEIIENLEKYLGEVFASGGFKKEFPDDPEHPIRQKQPERAFNFRNWVREAQREYKVSLRDAVRVALVCMERAGSIQEAATMRQLAARTQEQAATNEALAASAQVIVDSTPVAEVDPVSAKVEADLPSAIDLDIAASVAVMISSDEAPPSSVVAPASADEMLIIEDEPVAAVALPVDEPPPSIDLVSVVEPPAPDEVMLVLDGDGGDDPMQTRDEAQSAAPVQDAVSEIQSLLSQLDFSAESSVSSGGGAKSSDETQSSTTKPKKISLLTLRPVGEDDDAASESTVEARDIQARIAEVDLIIGEKTDLLEIQSDAEESVRKLEKATSYVSGATPQSPTLGDLDGHIGALLRAAEDNSPNF